MMQVLVDTHAFLWAVTGDPRLPMRTQLLLASFENEVYVSAASAWEIATKYRLGKLPGAQGLAGDIAGSVERLGFHALAISLEHAERAGRLPGPNRDPFDRMLIAQSQAENLPLVSNEELFDSFSIERIW
jgi:PIN domain nuclease of toxin-antitoxin system